MERLLTFNRQILSCNWVAIFLMATFFTLPISSSGKSISMILALIAIAFTADNREAFYTIVKQPWCKFAFLLFGFALLACFWSPASLSKRLFVLEKYSKLIYLPLLVAGLRDRKVRSACFYAFFAATLLTSLLAISRFYGVLNLNINPEHVFRNHIMTGFMVSFACYMAIYFFVTGKDMPQQSRWVYLPLAIIYACHLLFVNGGRTGYVIFLLLMTLLLIQLLSWKKALAGIMIISLIAVCLYKVNEDIHRRVDTVALDFHNYKHNQKDSSLGFRLQFHDFADKLFKQRPVLGHGTASFTYYFSVMNPVPSWGHGLNEPHSQYWLTAAEFGIAGLTLLALFYLSLLKAIWRFTPARVIGLGIMIPFLLGNLTDSLMFYSGSGYFFLLFMALSLGGTMEGKQNALSGSQDLTRRQ